MPALGGADRDSNGVGQDDRRMLRYLIPAGLAVLLVATIFVIATSTGASGSRSASSHAAPGGKQLPLYWTVRRGQTFAQIAKKTGLSIAQLKALNPSTDPRSILPGERLELRQHPPAPPHPKHLGPQFWTLRSGQSFGSIAAKTGKSIIEARASEPAAEGHHPAARRSGKTAPLSRFLAVAEMREPVRRRAYVPALVRQSLRRQHVAQRDPARRHRAALHPVAMQPAAGHRSRSPLRPPAVSVDPRQHLVEVRALCQDRSALDHRPPTGAVGTAASPERRSPPRPSAVAGRLVDHRRRRRRMSHIGRTTTTRTTATM